MTVERRVRRLRVMDLEVEVASLALGIAAFRLAVTTPVSVARAARSTSVRVPWTAHGLAGMLVFALRPRSGSEVVDVAEHGSMGQVVRDASRADALSSAFVAATGSAGAVGPPTTVGDRVVVPLTETVFAGGYGGGGGSASADAKDDFGAGGGGGGFARSRAVAIVELTPDGVEVKPVIDASGIAIAAIGSAVALAGVLVRFWGRRR